MNRRHFLNHLASSTVIGSSVTNFTNSILANAAEMKKNTKSVKKKNGKNGAILIEIQYSHGVFPFEPSFLLLK